MTGLTLRQRQVAELVALGYTNKRIAAELGISLRRVQVLIAQVGSAIGGHADRDDRVQIALWWADGHRKAG